MAEKERCVLCGSEFSFLSSSTIRIGETTQWVCTDCEKRYTGAGDGERLRLLKQMRKSDTLKDAERFDAYVAYLEKKNAGMGRRYQCCGKAMDHLGRRELQQGSSDMITGNWGNLLAGSLQVVLFRCNSCGQLKFYDPAYMAASAEWNTICPQCGKSYPGYYDDCPDCNFEREKRPITCPRCGTVHDFYAMKCPKCGYEYTGDEQNKPSEAQDAARERELERQLRNQEKREKGGWFGRKKSDKPKWEL